MDVIKNAIRVLKRHYDYLKYTWKPYPDQNVLNAIGVAVSALEKQIPKKPDRGYDENDFGVTYYPVCPICKGTLGEEQTMCEEWFNFCPLCGQAIDWSEYVAEKKEEE